MIHKKSVHNSSKLCQKYIQGQCNRPDGECWFSHSKSDNLTKKDFQLVQMSAPPDRLAVVVEELRIKMDQMEKMVSQILQK